MEFLEVLFVSIGGTATVLLVVGLLSKYLLTQLLAKDLEIYKAKLSHENNITLEAIKAEIQRNAKNVDRLVEFEQVMRRYKGPLLHSVYDLQSRIFNIIVQGLIEVYLINGNKQEQDYVVNNTVFVIAQYFAWAEIIRREIQFIDFSGSENTKKLSELQDNFHSLWQTDRFHDTFRVWAGEQRAIGELMIEEHNNRLVCIGYAEFLKRMKNNQNHLFSKLQSDVFDLSKNSSASYPRLREIQHTLIDILAFLDPDYLRFPEERRKYIP